MITNTLRMCNQNLQQMACCHIGRVGGCNCYECLRAGFYNNPDDYCCEKKLNYYVLNYGVSYASEFYHYFNNSAFMSDLLKNDTLTVKSLGCGFCPDYFALKKYIYDNGGRCQLNYIGYEESLAWNSTRNLQVDQRIIAADITRGIDLRDADVVVLGKVFSTLYRNNRHQDFLDAFVGEINSTLHDGAIVVFNDVNNIKMGRDVFHGCISRVLRNFNCYYFDGYTGMGWSHINQNQAAFNIPEGLFVSPLNTTGCTVVFEYRK